MTVDKQDRDYIIFRVKAVSDAHITLTDTVNDYSRGYEVVIGGWTNTQSAIRHPPAGNIVHQVATEDLLSGNEWRTFWISYNYGQIETGSGSDVGANRIMSWYAGDSYMTIKAVSVSSYAVVADWEFTQLEGK